MSAALSKPTGAGIAATFAVVLWIALTKVPVALNEDRWDSRFYQLTGLQVLEGAKPYRDFWELKPPGMFYLMALGGLVSDTSLVQFAVLDGVFNLLTLLVASRILRLLVSLREETSPGLRWRLGAAGWLCVALAAVLTSHTAMTSSGNLSECYVFLPESLSVAAGIGALRRSGRVAADGEVSSREAFLAGIFAAMAGLIRPTGLAGIGALELAWLAHGRWRLALAGIAGLTAGLAPVVAVFWNWGLAAEMFHAAVVFPLLETTEGRAPLLKSLGNVWPLAGPALLVAAWVASRAFSMAGHRSSSELAARFREAKSAVLLWAAVDLAGALLQGHHRQHYFIPLSLSLPVAAALPLAELWGRHGDGRPRPAWRRFVVGGALAAWILVAAFTELMHVVSARPVEQSNLPWMQVVRFLRGRVWPGERIFVADYIPSIYVMTKTRPVSRWVSLNKAHDIGLPTERTREAAFREALSARPRFIVSTAMTPVRRAVSILEHRAVRVFACGSWTVWRRLDKRFSEQILARKGLEREGPADGRPGLPVGVPLQPPQRDGEVVELQVPATPCPILLVSVAFRDSVQPASLELRSDGRRWPWKIGGGGSQTRIESIEIPVPRSRRVALWAQADGEGGIRLERVELAGVAERQQHSDAALLAEREGRPVP